mmetsp:Transcript_29530/g.75154  ORF Transcript_29530/g.75154 Transcript_29530/m.75154 type:complete len:104 (-) Transcript_29530:141-452(-)
MAARRVFLPMLLLAVAAFLLAGTAFTGASQPTQSSPMLRSSTARQVTLVEAHDLLMDTSMALATPAADKTWWLPFLVPLAVLAIAPAIGFVMVNKDSKMEEFD